VSIARWSVRMLTLLVTRTMVFVRIRVSTLGGTSPVSSSTTASRVVMGKNFNRNEPQLRDIIRDQLRRNDDFGKKIHATDKLLENISAKMDSFTVATQNQLSFNKLLETHI
jgi:hypothetical protein